MPLFFFSTDNQFDSDDALEFPDAGVACAQAEFALRAIAAESSVAELSMTVWDERGVAICQYRLIVTKDHPHAGNRHPKR